jgi:hypothetical protein
MTSDPARSHDKKFGGCAQRVILSAMGHFWQLFESSAALHFGMQPFDGERG